MKNCVMCKESKEVLEFHKNKTKKDGYSNICKLCRKSYHSKWYLDNKECVLNHNRNNCTKNKEYVLNYLKDNCCVDCGESDPIVLEFDHQRDKKFNISDALSQRYGLKRIIEEIGKCEVVCGNCHKKRTCKTQNWFKGKNTD